MEERRELRVDDEALEIEAGADLDDRGTCRRRHDLRLRLVEVEVDQKPIEVGGELNDPTGEDWLYLAAILDMHTRKIVGWCMRQSLHAEIAIDALTMAIERQRPAPGLIHHSDRGIQYAAEAYRQTLATSGISPSMSRKGDCWDNAPMESFFHTLKTERVHHRVYATRDQARRDLFQYIEGFYNPRRLHSALGYISPAEAERRAA